MEEKRKTNLSGREGTPDRLSLEALCNLISYVRFLACAIYSKRTFCPSAFSIGQILLRLSLGKSEIAAIRSTMIPKNRKRGIQAVTNGNDEDHVANGVLQISIDPLFGS